MNVLGTALLPRGIAVICIYGILAPTLPAQSANPAASTTQTASQTAVPVRFDMPKSHNPLNAYSPDYVPEPALANSQRLDRMVREGKLYLSLKDAIDLALENNLDLAIARYNLPIANTDILRTQAGGSFRGRWRQCRLVYAACIRRRRSANAPPPLPIFRPSLNRVCPDSIPAYGSD